MNKYNIKISSLALLASFFIISACDNSTNKHHVSKNEDNQDQSEIQNQTTNLNNDPKMILYKDSMETLKNNEKKLDEAKTNLLEDSSLSIDKIKDFLQSHADYCKAVKPVEDSGNYKKFLNITDGDYPKTFEKFKNDIRNKYRIQTLFTDKELPTVFNYMWKVLEQNKKDKNTFNKKLFFRDYNFKKAPYVAQGNSHKILDLNDENVLQKVIVVDHKELSIMDQANTIFKDIFKGTIFTGRNTKFLKGEKGVVYQVLKYIKEENKKKNEKKNKNCTTNMEAYSVNDKPIRVMHINDDGSIELSIVKLNGATNIDKMDVSKFSDLYYIYYNGDKGTPGWAKVSADSIF